MGLVVTFKGKSEVCLWLLVLKRVVTSMDILLGIYLMSSKVLGCPSWLSDKESACQCRRCGLIPGLGRSPGEGNGNALLYPSLENPVDRGASRSSVHGVQKSWTHLRMQYKVLRTLGVSKSTEDKILSFEKWEFLSNLLSS